MLEVLLITHDFPFPVKYGGQVYTGNIAMELARHPDVNLTCFCFANEDEAGGLPRVQEAYGATWNKYRTPKPSRLRQAFSRYPNLSVKARSKTFEKAIVDEIRGRRVDVVM